MKPDSFLKDLSIPERTFFKIIDGLNRKGAHTNPETVRVNIRNFLECTCKEHILPIVKANSIGVDIGAGYGLLSEVLKQHSITVYNLDKNHPMGSLGMRIEGIAEDLPYDTNSLDVAFIFYAFNHFDNPRKAFSEAHRVIKKDGHIITMMEFDRYKGQNYFVRLNELSMNNIIYHNINGFENNNSNITKEEFEGMIKDHSLEIILRKEYHPTKWYDKAFKTAKSLYILRK
jgi:ubiquinone/menaquinone biosynthesis C-methylase UbiE